MSVTTTTARKEYTGDGSQVTFPYDFKIFQTSDLQAYVDGVLQTEGTHYSVTNAGNPAGGDVIFVTAPGNGKSVLLLRALPQTQETVYPSNDKFPAKVHEDVADRAVMLIQQLTEVDARALKLAVTSLFSEIVLGDPSVGKFLRWKNTNEIEAVDLATLGGSIGLPVGVVNGGTGLAAAGADGETLTSILGALAHKPPGLVRMTNKSGGTLTAGTVVVPSSANDQAFSTTTVVGSGLPVLVLQEDVANNASGFLHQRGIVATVKVQGNVSRYDHLRTSATAGRAESAGATKVTGSFAMALSAYGGGGAGTVIALLYGDTHVSASIPAYSDTEPIDNLVIVYASASTLTITADGVKMLDSGGNSRTKRSLNVTADITTTGLNGRDTAAAEAGTKWYWIWAVSNGTTDGVMLVPDAGAGSATAPATSVYAWTYSKLLGAVFNDGSSNFVPFRQRNKRVDYTGDTTNGPRIVFAAKNGSTSFVSENLATFIPPARVDKVRGVCGTDIATPTFGMCLSPNSAGEYESIINVYNNSALTKLHNWFCAMPFEIQWISGTDIYWRSTLTTAAAHRLGIRGFDLVL